MRSVVSKSIVGIALSVAFGISAPRALPGSPFEGADGNLAVDTLADWQSFAGSNALAIGQDLPSGQSDDSLSGKEDDASPGIDFGSIPNNKSDLRRFYLAHQRILSDNSHKDFLYLGWVRAYETGSADIDFEFNQSQQLSSNGVTPVRTPGDILITFTVTGGDVVDLGISRWITTGKCESSDEKPCWGKVTPLSGIAEGAVNQVSIQDPLAGVTLAPLTFGEAAINLTDAGVFDSSRCLSFGRAFVKSRSTASFNGSLKDFIQPIGVYVSNCATVNIVKDARPDSSEAFQFISSPELGTSGFTLDDDGDGANDLSNLRSYFGPMQGQLSVAEQSTPGWDLAAVNCSGNATPELDGQGRPTGTVQLNVTPGDLIECTFVNEERGRIVLDEVTLPADSGPSFDFTLAGGPDAIGASASLTDSDPAHEFTLLRPGLYSLSQLAAAGNFDLTSASCSDGSPIGAVNVAPGETVTCTFVNKLTLHPGPTEFWRDWSSHYSEEELLAIATEALSGSDAFAALFDENGQPLPDFLDQLAAIFDEGGDPSAQLLADLATILLDLAVSSDDHPEIHGFQQNDDICLDCVIDLQAYPGAAALLAQWADCFVPETPTVGDLIEAAQAAWDGTSFALMSQSEQTLLMRLLAAAGEGTIIVVDLSVYPDDLRCVEATVPQLMLLHLDDDGDGYGSPGPAVETCALTTPAGFADNDGDCDDDHAAVHPGASEVCDGLSNDCAAAGWPVLTGIETDDDGDALSECGGDCNDTDISVRPGAVELCDAKANDCDSPDWPLAPSLDRDDDLDGFTPCGGDCDDAHAAVRPGGTEICDGLNDDCTSPSWPAVSPSEADADHDGLPSCGGDCNDFSFAIHPAAAERCNGIDDNCDGLADEAENGLDFDADGLLGACDSCPADFDPSGADFDHDSVGDLCDNCASASNSDQIDFDFDGEGDRCDANDGLIVLYALDHAAWEWHDEPAFDTWNLYRGDLDVMEATGVYTQDPGSNALAGAACDLVPNTLSDVTEPSSEGCAFYLVAGVSAGVEGSLGTRSDGSELPSAGECISTLP